MARRGRRFLPCRMARLLRPAGWRGRTVANGNIKVRLKEPTMDRRRFFNLRFGVASLRLVRILPL